MNNHHSTPVPESDTGRTPEGKPLPGASSVSGSASSPAGGGQNVSSPAGGGRNAGWGTPSSAAGSDFPPAAGWGSSRQPGGWEAPAGRSKPWTMKRGVVVAGAAAVLAGGAGVGIYALTTSSAAADGTDGTADAGALQETLPGSRGGAQGGFADGGMSAQGGPGSFAPEGLGGMGSGVSGAVHSEYVILQDGAYVTKVEQQGTVTEVSSNAVTVKSTDGFSRTYSLDSDVAVSNQQQRRQQAGGPSASTLTVADIVSGAMVRIVAAKEGDSFPAESVQLVAATLTGQTN